jgi:hypothetical protein
VDAAVEIDPTPRDAPAHAASVPAQITERDFPTVLGEVAGVAGWMTDEQAKRLWWRASERRSGETIVEIGSYQGRSAIILAAAAPEGVAIVCIDPHGGNDRGPQQYDGAFADGQADHEAFVANLTRTGAISRIRHLRRTSQAAAGDVDPPVELLYIDGAHRYRPCRADIERWGEKVPVGGTLLIHDAFSSVGVTLALASTLLRGDRFRYVGRSGTMAEYRAERLGPAARLMNATRQVAEVPYFARNVLFKLLLLARLRPVVRFLGGTGEWPY